MGKTLKRELKRFDGGIESSGREKRINTYRFIQHFDIHNSPYKLVPFRDMESDESDGNGGVKDNTLKNFTLGTNGSIYAVGSASSKNTMYSRANPTTGDWSEDTTNGQATNDDMVSVHSGLIEWKSKWYGWNGTDSIFEYNPGTGYTEDKTTTGSAFTTTAPSVIGADGNMYMFYDNKVVRVDSDGAGTDDVFTAIPDDMRITSVCRWNSYLAIGCAQGTATDASPTGRSQVFLWDYVTESTAYDIIDWGEGALRILENIEGRLVGVSDRFMEQSKGDDDLGIGEGSMIVKMWAGGIPKIMSEIVANQSVTLGRFIQDKVVKDGRLYWVASVPYSTSTATESTFKLGIWCFGRKDQNSEFALTLAYIEDNIDTSNYKIVSFGNAGNYWFIAHSNDGSIEKTSNTATYTTTSAIETRIYGDGMTKEKLKGVKLSCEKQPSGGQTVIKYKKDGGTTWTTISTNDTDDVLKHEALRISSDKSNLPHFREIEFRLESTGGTVITGFEFISEIIEEDLYA